tara:strand:+ start:1 stop:1113 length:1113 start_codon:yes stop_codon:yes gene_type:complete
MNKYFDNFYDWWKNLDKFLFILILSLFILGLFFSLMSTSLIASNKLSTNSYYFFLKHLVFITLAISIIFILSILKKDLLLKVSIILFIITFLSLISVQFFGIEVKGSKRWLDLPFFPRFQPVELFKPFFIIILSMILTINQKKIYFKYFLSILILLPVVLFVSAQPDIGQTLLITVVWLTLVFISGVNLILFFLSSIFISIFTLYLIFFVSKFEYIKIRLMSFLDLSSGNNYQSDKASDAIISGGIFGKGIGEGTLNTKIPEAHTDYIVSVVSEEFGILIVILILTLYLVFSYKIIKKTILVNNDLLKLILIGCMSIIIIQTFVHVGVNIRVLPTTGMTLPFLSYGGSSIISTAIISGIILNFTKRDFLK